MAAAVRNRFAVSKHVPLRSLNDGTERKHRLERQSTSIGHESSLRPVPDACRLTLKPMLSFGSSDASPLAFPHFHSLQRLQPSRIVEYEPHVGIARHARRDQ
jgi:hypothetical protein